MDNPKQKLIFIATATVIYLVALAILPAVTREPAVSAAQPHQPSVVVLWNEAMLAAIRKGAPRPTVTARSLFLVHQAMYEAWSLYDTAARPSLMDPSARRPAVERNDVNKAAAVSQAAYHALLELYPDYEKQSGAFSRLLAQLGYEVAQTGDPTTPGGIGLMAARAVLDARESDGSNGMNNYADIVSARYPTLYQPRNSADPSAPESAGGSEFDPALWQPLRVPTGTYRDIYGYPVTGNEEGTYVEQRFLTPQWGAVTPYALSSGDQFRPAPPPRPGSSEPYTDGLGRHLTNDEGFRMQVDEILSISANLTDEQKVIAEYWSDGPRSETPPGHWNALAHGISMRDGHTIDEDVKLYFALNGALFDASIASWDAKRAYDFIRPISAIRHLYAGQEVLAWGGPGKGAMLIDGDQWLPYQEATFVTPGFPEYVSGHSTFSAAAAAVLTSFTGSPRFYDGKTMLYHEDFDRDGLPDMLGQHVAAVNSNKYESSPAELVVLKWLTFQQAADEAGMSRRYGGIHFQDGDLRGREMGRAIGEQAYEQAARLWGGIR